MDPNPTSGERRAADEPPDLSLSHLIVVLAGPAGSGKTVVGRALALELEASFHDADEFHLPASRAKMQSGVPLTDADREPWLGALHEALRGWLVDGGRHVLACSALKAAHRRRLREALPRICFIWLRVPSRLLAARLQTRSGHFFTPNLLGSQLAAMEMPAPEEDVWTVEVAPSETPQQLAKRLRAGLEEDV